MSKALAGFGSGSAAKPKSTASPLGAAVVAAAQAQAAAEAKQQSPTAKAVVANVASGRYAILTKKPFSTIFFLSHMVFFILQIKYLMTL